MWAFFGKRSILYRGMEVAARFDFMYNIFTPRILHFFIHYICNFTLWKFIWKFNSFHNGPATIRTYATYSIDHSNWISSSIHLLPWWSWPFSIQRCYVSFHFKFLSFSLWILQNDLDNIFNYVVITFVWINYAA
jgi:hypothetical protein